MDFFGKKSGQTSVEFLREVNALTEQEKDELAAAISLQTGDTLKKV